MSKVTKPLILDETGQKIVQELRNQNVLLNILAGTRIEEISSLEQIARIVRSGNASKVFQIGDQITVPWTDNSTGVTYSVPHDVVSFDNAMLKNGESVSAMYLQWHYTTPRDVTFDDREAFYCSSDGELATGQYNFVYQGNTYVFTLTKKVPVNGVITVVRESNSFTLTTRKKAGTSFLNEMIDIIEPRITATIGSGGTPLGSFDNITVTKTNNTFDNALFGYGNWSQSNIRQWLNSKKESNWFKAQNPFDFQSSRYKNVAGFMSGYEEDFLSCIKPVLVPVATSNSVDRDKSSGGKTDTFDYFFLPSRTELNIEAGDISPGSEGHTFKYWAFASEDPKPLKGDEVFPQMQVFGIDNKQTPRAIWTGSCSQTDSSNVHCIEADGRFRKKRAFDVAYCTPVCAIC